MKKEKNRSQKDKKTGYMSVLRGGLSRTLFFWFLFLSLVPLTVISVVSYQKAADSLSDSTLKSLNNAVYIKTAYINSYFDRIMDDLRFQSMETNNIKFLKALHMAQKKSGKAAGEFVKSFRARMLYDEYSSDLRSFQKTFGYYDVLLICLKGNILFSVAEEDDLGTNLFNGKYSGTRFGIAAKKAFETGQVTFSDYENYAPLNGDTTGFLIDVILDDDGDKIGLIAVQLSMNKIDSLMHLRSGQYETEDAYLLGKDLKMRSNSPLIEEETVLKQVVDSEQSQSWLHESGDDHGTSMLSSYIGYRGTSVIGFHDDLEIAGVHFGVFGEIDEAEALAPAVQLRNRVIILFIIVAIGIVFIAPAISRRLVLPIRRLSGVSKLVASGDLNQEINITSKNEIGELAQNFNQMVSSLRHSNEEADRHNWVKDGQTGLNEIMRGEQTEEELGTKILSFIAEYFKAQVGAFYVRVDDGMFKWSAGYAYRAKKDFSNEFKAGEGIVGQVALEKQPILLTDVPDNYINVTSGLGAQKPKNIFVLPLIHNKIVMGVLELGSFEEFTDLQMTFLKEASHSIAIALTSARSRKELNDSFQRIKAQAVELQAQQEELRTSNEELEEQARQLQASEEELKAQQEELQATNEELEEKSQSLVEQTEAVVGKNRELQDAQKALKKKAEDLEITGKYKSEFLANMSHELRTPLNSLLLLSQDLASNKEKNLSAEQAESAEIIYSSGSDLLKLINEILDLSKIEAGKMTISVEKVWLEEVANTIHMNFKHVTGKKGLELNIKTEEDLSESIWTDRQKLEQIIKNFMSNAIKFTAQGTVTVDIHRPSPEVDLSHSGLRPEEAVAFSFTDTGIGIPEEKQREIFEAFQQVDGSTSRKYGGTGLGLSISRELAKILGGFIQLSSKEGEGATFTLYLPVALEQISDSQREHSGEKPKTVGQAIAAKPKAVEQAPAAGAAESAPPAPTIDDDRNSIGENDRVILVIEDDLNFAKTLFNLCHKRDFKCIHAGDGETGLAFAGKYKPDAVLLDINLPNIGGWEVLESIKHNPDIRHIPVHIMSADDEPADVIKQGAIGYLTKPVSAAMFEQAFSRIEEVVSKDVKKLLIVEDDEITRKHIVKLVDAADIQTTAVATGEAAIRELSSDTYGCMVLDLKLPDMSGFEVLEKLEEQDINTPPVIIYSAKDLTREEESRLQEYASSIIVKGADSEGRLLDETTLFLHRVVEDLPAEKRKIIASLYYDDDPLFRDKKILVVDDDMRNLFVLSKLLSERNVKVYKSADGLNAIETLEKEADIDLVLMDIMMPGMDGFETMRRIRAQKQLNKLPIIAVTAKAMSQDREQCIEAGANDYVTKPIDFNKLLSVMRVWLHKE